MSRHLQRILGVTIIAGWTLLTLGCASSGSSTVHYGYYAGDYWHDPYWGRCCYGDVDIDVHHDHDRPDNRPPGARPRPPVARPPGARPPGARPPGMRPPGMRPPGGMPSRPRPMPRGRGRR